MGVICRPVQNPKRHSAQWNEGLEQSHQSVTTTSLVIDSKCMCAEKRFHWSKVAGHSETVHLNHSVEGAEAKCLLFSCCSVALLLSLGN